MKTQNTSWTNANLNSNRQPKTEWKKKTEQKRNEKELDNEKIMFNIFIRCYNKIVIINNFSDEHQREFWY